ncbi:MAG: hypothetical protein KAT68_17920 [Bacteroidales bacterium]|nr:hypothetical protein [Bacteroidales bacterium]
MISHLSVIFLFIIVILLYYSVKEKLLLYIPILEAVREVFFFWMPSQNREIGFLIIYTIIIIKLLNKPLSFLTNSWKKKIVNKYNFAAVIFFLFLVFGLLRTTNFLLSIQKVWEYSIVVFILPISIIYVLQNKSRINIYIRACYISAAIYISSILFFSFFQLGRTFSYGGHSIIFLGGLSLWRLYAPLYLSIFTVLFSIFLKDNKLDIFVSPKRLFHVFWIFINIIFIGLIFLIGKRAFIILPPLGILVFYFSFYKLSITKYIRIILFGILLYFAAYAIGFNEKINHILFIERQLADKEITQEGRYLEYEDYFIEVRYRDNMFILFGEEIFNSRAVFFQKSNLIFDRDRILHSDITHFLYGIGILGLLSFFFLLIRLFIIARIAYKGSVKSKQTQFIWSVFITIYLVSFAHNFTGGIFLLSGKIIQWQMMGILIGILIINNKMIVKNAR